MLTVFAIGLDEEENRRLALLDPVLGVLELLQTLGKRGQVPGEIDQELNALLTIGITKFRDDRFKCGGQRGFLSTRSTGQSRVGQLVSSHKSF